MKIYIADSSQTKIGGGFTFRNNLIKALKDKVQFVDNWLDCDIVFLFSVTAIIKSEIYEAIRAGKKLVMRVDNIPRRSRNKRQSPAERLEEFGKLASKVIYQSEWAKRYAGYFAGEGIIIYNGVDTDIFNKNGRNSDGKTYLYVNYNDNPNKRFDEAMYWFDMAWREDNSRHMIIAGNVPKMYLEHPEFHWDLPTNGKVEYLGILNEPGQVANVMKRSDFLICPYFAEACSNVVLEAMACGLELNNMCLEGSTYELWDWFRKDPYTIYDMGDEYLKIFNEVIKK